MTAENTTRDKKANPNIIDNRSICFKDVIKKYLQHAIKAQFATGYFYLSGFNLLKEDLEHLQEINILMGDETDRLTCDDIVAGYRAKLISDSERLDDNKPQFKSLIALKDFIQQGKVNIKVYVPENNGNFHTKLYIIHRDKIPDIQDLAILGSSNLTRPGIMGNTELNYLHLSPETVEAFEGWFNERFKEAKDFNADLIRIIESSKAYKRYEAKQKDLDYITPFELYKLIMYEYLNGDISTYESALAEFQKLAVENAKEKIRKYNGAIISDSVGLGKSFVGGELIKWYLDQNKKILLIVPASIIDQWRDLLETDGVSEERPYFGLKVDGSNLRIISDTEFSNYNKDEVQKKCGKVDVILIDEAHRFRNNKPKRYENIQELKGKVFILLSATPLNNTVKDLKNLINIFTTDVELTNEKLKFSAFDDYYRLSKQVNNKTATPEDIKLLNESVIEIDKTLDEVMLLRTRKVIKERYPNLEINGKKIEFSTPIILQEEYKLSSKYEPIYQHIDTFIAELNLPYLYVVNQAKGKSLEALFKVTLLKRLESSIYSFIKSLNQIINSETSLRNDIKSLGFESTIQSRRDNFSKIEQQIQTDADVQSDIEGGGDKNRTEDLNEEQIIGLIKFDIESIYKFKKLFLDKVKRGSSEYEYDDDKLDRLISELHRRRNDKILIFTQYQATAKYLNHHLKNFGYRNVDCVVGGLTSPSGRKVKYNDGGQTKERLLSKRDLKVRLFSPKSYNFKLEKGEKETDILISTDTLSEGVNLQDCNVIINYDLPWNPTRVIQRVGRVDRIGNNNQITVIHFYPDKDIETLLHLLERLQTKIKDIATIVGKETGILSGDEEVNIRTIGEKITELRKYKTVEDIEDNARNPRLNPKGESTLAAIRFKLRDQITEWGLTKTDFKREYSNVPYSIAELSKRGVFSLYQIYDDKNKDKLRNTLLYYNPEDGSISEQKPYEFMFTPQTPGYYRAAIIDKIDIESGLSHLNSHFEELFIEEKNRFSGAEMAKTKTSQVQTVVVNRLNEILKQRTFDENIERQKSSLYELKSLYRNVFLKVHDAGKLKEKLKGKPNTDIFIQILKEFKKEVINDNPDYQSYLRSSENIKYKQVCWGASI